MEGPSLVLLTEELKPFYKKKVRKAEGLLLANFPFLKSSTFKSAKSWGKHLILLFDKGQLRIHFLMFGSYRVDQPRDRDPKLSLKFEGGTVYFYSCAIKEISKADIADYDFTIDLMSDQWDEKKAVKSIRSKPETQLGDILMDQAIF
ncbi:MAG: endonuclease, partial [Proteobacteria bacterium]